MKSIRIRFACGKPARAGWMALSLFLFSSTGLLAQSCTEWVKREDVGSYGQRTHHAMVYDSHRGVTVFFGGEIGNADEQAFFNDTQEYDGTQWRQISVVGPKPSPRSLHAMAYDPISRKVVLYGGHDGFGEAFGDTWLYTGDGVNGFWELVLSATQPLPSREHAMVYDSVRNKVILHGGNYENEDFEVVLDSTYEWNGSVWTHVASSPYPMREFGMAFDDFRARAITFGGYGQGYIDRPYEYQPGIGWSETTTTFPRRAQPAMAYDAGRGRVVVVGGVGDTPALGENVLEFAPGKGWVALPSLPSGQGRAGARMVYDSRRRVLVLTGGAGGGAPNHEDGGRYSDTWELRPIPLTFNIIAPPTNQLICLSNSVSVYSQPSDSRPLSQQWFVNGVRLDGQTNGTLNYSAIPFFGNLPFQLEATDLCGNRFTSAVAVVTVHRPPNIVSFDSSTQYRCPGESFIVPVTAMSTLQPVTYQWFFNDTAIDLATHPTLSLQTLAHENTGFYRVRVRNECGDTFSEPKYLQVGVTITKQPTNREVRVCETAGLSVQARGVGSLRFQWRLDGLPLTNNAYFVGVTTSNLVIHPCLYAYEGNYDAVITDDCGSIHSVTSRVAKLTIKPGPEWVLRATNGPPARSGHSMAYDTARKVTVLFGGLQINPGSAFAPRGDLWEWNGASWLQRMPHSLSNGWTFTTENIWRPSYTSQPVNRYQHNLAYDSLRGRVVLFGGQTRTPDGFQVFLNDTWEWDGTTWHFLATNGPVSRANAGMAFDSTRGVTVMIGGFVQGGTPDPNPRAVWEWNGTVWNMRVPTNGPPPNYSQETGGMAYDSFRRMTIFGPTIENDPSARWAFWAWDGATWKKVFDNYVAQFWGLQYGDLAFDSYRRRSVWFGGQFGVPSGETGFFDGQNWDVLLNNPTPPAPRFHHAMAYDISRRSTVMFGGETGAQNFNGETWELIALDVPLINDQPVSQYRQVGETVVFRVSARGPTNSVLQYQWLKNGQLLATGGRVSGATSSQLLVANILPGDVGEYVVRVSNLCGATFSSPAVLLQGSGAPALLAVNAVTPIPGGVANFINLPQGPGFSGNNVAFYGVGSLGQQGIYLTSRSQATPPVKIADLNTAIPNGTGNFMSFLNYASQPTDPCIDAGNVAFFATGSSGQQGIYAWINSTLIRVVDTATAIPGGTGNFTATPTDPCISGDAVVFVGSGSGGQQGVYLSKAGALSVVADTHTPIPGGIGNFTSAPTEPCVSGDAVIFVGSGSGGQQGVYLAEAGTLSVIADTHTAIPSGVGNFTTIPTEPCINGDRVAFVGNGSGGQQGVYLKMPGDPCVSIADLQTSIPDGVGQFTGFGAVSISETDLAFIGHGVGGQTGIYDFVDDELFKVVAIGDSIGGKKIVGLDFSRNGLWGDPVAFQATFDDGSEGLYTMDIIVPFVLRVTLVERVGNNLRLRFKSVIGRNYVIQSRTDPVVGEWTDLPGPPIAGTGNVIQTTITPAPGESRQFYRVKQLP